MTDVKRYRKPEKNVEWYATKYDTFKLVNANDYRLQKGSARSECFALAKDGMLVSTWTKKCVEIGHNPTFAVNCVQKLYGAKEPGWTFSEKNAEGLTYEQVKGSRTTDNAKKKVEKKAKKESKPKKKRAPKKQPSDATAEAAAE